MATYIQAAAGLHTDECFALFFGCQPHPMRDEDKFIKLLAFMFCSFGETECNPDDEDEVVQFCQWAIAGNYGRPPSDEQIRAKHPTWNPEYVDLVSDAWEAHEQAEG